METSSAEKREFRMHKDILWSIIKSQAGTLGKAILELCSNSIDAGATRVDIQLTGRSVKVSDNGKGFTDRTEIEAFFETFGTPHQAGDSKFGRFRMGRGQVMAYSRNVWRSGVFQMNVDIRDLGLAYELRSDLKPFQGCSIEADLYDPMKPSEVIATIDNLRALCKYSPIPIYVNGDLLSVDMTTQTWTHEDDDAYYLLRESTRCLEVYNLGLHVMNRYRGELGIGGVIVSKAALQMNFARNDILINECQVFKRISAKARAFAKKNEDKRPAQNESYRELMLGRLLQGAFDEAEEFETALDKAKVLTDYSGRHHSVTGLLQAASKACGTICSVEEHTTKADRVHQGRLAVVMSPKTYERAGNLSLAKVLDRLEKNLKQFHDVEGTDVRSRLDTLSGLRKSLQPIELVGALVKDEHRVVPDKELSKEERLVLGVLNELQWMFGRKICSKQPREIRVCESEAIDGYTDGRSVIFVNQKFLRIGGAPGQAFTAFECIKALLVHEYLHDADDSTGHGHPAEFFEAFHEVMSDKPCAHAFSYDAVRCYLSARRRSGFKLRSGDLKALDMVVAESDQMDDDDPSCNTAATAERQLAVPA